MPAVRQRFHSSPCLKLWSHFSIRGSVGKDLQTALASAFLASHQAAPAPAPGRTPANSPSRTGVEALGPDMPRTLFLFSGFSGFQAPIRHPECPYYTPGLLWRRTRWRWTQASEPTSKTNASNPVRGNKVFQWSKRFLDEIAPLSSGSHAQVRGYAVQEGRLAVSFESMEATWLESFVQLLTRHSNMYRRQIKQHSARWAPGRRRGFWPGASADRACRR